MPSFRPHGYVRNAIVPLSRALDGINFQSLIGAPALAVDNRYVTVTAMKVGAYTVANASPADGLARNIIVTVAKQDTNDTMGTLAVVGTDADGVAINETITPNNGDTSSGITYGAKCFATVTSVTGAGWVIGGTTADNIKVGFGPLVGLPKAVAAAADIFLATLDGANVDISAAGKKGGDGTLSGSYVDCSASTYNGTKKLVVCYLPADTKILTNTGALVMQTLPAAGHTYEIEEFGFSAASGVAGASGSLIFDLKVGTVTKASLTIAGPKAAGSITSTTTIASATVIDTDVLTLNRRTGGTAFTGGTGRFWIRTRQRTQAPS